RVGMHSTAGAKAPPRSRPGERSHLEHECSVYENAVNAFCRTSRAGVSRDVGDCRGIENHHVRCESGPDQATVGKAESACRMTGQVQGRGAPRPITKLARMYAEVAGECAPATRMRCAPEIDAVGAGNMRLVSHQSPHLII